MEREKCYLPCPAGGSDTEEPSVVSLSSALGRHFETRTAWRSKESPFKSLEPWQGGDLVQGVPKQHHGQRDRGDAHTPDPEALAHRDQEQYQRKQHGCADVLLGRLARMGACFLSDRGFLVQMLGLLKLGIVVLREVGPAPAAPTAW